jgi:hypothetical protein
MTERREHTSSFLTAPFRTQTTMNILCSNSRLSSTDHVDDEKGREAAEERFVYALAVSRSVSYLGL